MQRRHFIAGAGIALAGSSVPLYAAGAHYVPYDRAAFDQRLASGEPLLLDFYASW